MPFGFIFEIMILNLFSVSVYNEFIKGILPKKVFFTKNEKGLVKTRTLLLIKLSLNPKKK